MYLISATIRRFEADGRQKEHEIFVHYCAKHGFNEIQKAFDGIFSNFDVPVLGHFLKYIVAPWSRINTFSSAPSDSEGSEIAAKVTKPGAIRDFMTQGIFIPDAEYEPVCKLEKAATLSVQSREVLKKVSLGMKRGTIPRGKPESKLQEARKEFNYGF